MRRFALAILLCSCATTRPNGTPFPPSPPKALDPAAIDAYVAAQVERKGFDGLSLAIARDGKIVLAKAYGTARPDTRFAVGSITKQFTAACILLLAEQGKLSVSDKVARWYPDLTRASDITLYDLLTHTSGYPDFYPLDFIDRRMATPTTIDEVIHRYATGKLDFEPGSNWSYSNTGYLILGRIVEKVSGQPFGTFLREHILGPVGMDHTAYDPQPGERDLAVGHSAFALGDAEPAPREAEGWTGAAGAIYSTASDLAKWDLALMDGKVLRPESLELMTTRRKLSNGRLWDYGCGLGIGRRDNETFYMHGGAVSGFLAQNAMVPRTRSAVVLLSNNDNLDPRSVFDPIFGLLLKDEARIPTIQGPPAKEVAVELMHQLQTGTIDRSALGEEFGAYLTDERVKQAAARLSPLGDPISVDLEGRSERGGMEVSVFRFGYRSMSLRAIMFRSKDGKVREFLPTRAD